MLATILRLALQLGPWLLRIYDLVTKLDPETRERFYELVRRWATAVKVPSRIGRIEARLDAAEVTIAELSDRHGPQLSEADLDRWNVQVTSLRAALRLVQQASGKSRSSRTKLIEERLNAVEREVFEAALGVMADQQDDERDSA